MVRFTLALLALTCAAVGAATGVSQAEGAKTWTHPNGLISIVQPQGWPAPEDLTRPESKVPSIVMGSADYECWFEVLPAPDTEAVSIDRINAAYGKPLASDQWVELVKNFRLFDGQAEVVSIEVDSTGPFPVQIATLKSTKSGTVIAALQGRPGWEARTYCVSYDGKDRTAVFREVGKSVGSPKDAEYVATLAAAAAPQPAPAE